MGLRLFPNTLFDHCPKHHKAHRKRATVAKRKAFSKHKSYGKHMAPESRESYHAYTYSLASGMADLSKPCGQLICMDIKITIQDSPPWCEVCRSQNAFTKVATLGKLPSVFITPTVLSDLSRETNLGHEDTDRVVRQCEGLEKICAKGTENETRTIILMKSRSRYARRI